MYRTFTDEVAFRAFACEFSRTLQPGDVVGLSGPLGAGKTTFVQSAVRELHGDDPVTSPTFTFWHRYEGAPPIDHLDLYRIDDPAELREMGLEEAFDGTSVIFVEWWEHAGGMLPPPTITVKIEGVGERPRSVEVHRP